MKKCTKVIALVLSCAMAAGVLAGCKKDKNKASVGTVNGAAIPDGLFINNFTLKVSEAQQTGNTEIDFSLNGESLYNNLKETKKEGTPYYDVFIEEALEACREFMIQYQIYSGKDGWPSESEIEKQKSSAESYVAQMFSYYGSSFGAATVQKFVQTAYGMTYDDLIEYFTMSSSLENYKTALQDQITPSDDELAEYFEQHKKDYKSVEVRHSLINTEKMDKEEKAEAYKKAQALVEKYKNGEITFNEILKESDDVSSEGKPNNDGYYTVKSDSSFVTSFKEWALARTEASDEIEIVESEYGYHIMQCTKVETPGLENEDVKKKAESAYKTELVDNQVEEETAPYLENKEYEIKKRNAEYIDKLAKRTFTGDFSDVESASPAPSASAEPTAKPEYHDAEADTTVVAKYKGQDVLKVYYTQFFSQAMNEIFTGYDFSAAGDSEEKFYELLNEAATKEYKDGKTYLEYAKEYGLELLRNFLATKDMAAEAGKTVSEEDRTKSLEELDTQIDSMLQYYGTAYGVSTRDELMLKLVYANVNDYKAVYIDQMLTSDYANEVIEAMKPEESELKAFYEKTPDDYRIVTIRHISRSLLNDDGEALSEEEQAEVLKLMETLKTKLENGDSAEALVAGYSEASDASAAKGLLDLKKTSASPSKEVVDWAFSQNTIGTVSIIKTDSSYELVILEGLTDYTSTSGTVASSTNTKPETIVSAVTSAYKNQTFEESVLKYVADHNLELTDVQNEIIEQVAKEYLTYEASGKDK